MSGAVRDSRVDHSEECYLCAARIRPGEPSTVYWGIRAHVDCYRRDVGIPADARTDRSVVLVRPPRVPARPLFQSA